MNDESLVKPENRHKVFSHPLGNYLPIPEILFGSFIVADYSNWRSVALSAIGGSAMVALGLLAVRIGRKISFEQAEFREDALVLSGLNKEFVFPYSEPLEITTELKFMDLYGWCVVVVEGRRYGLAPEFKVDVEFLRNLCSHWPEHLPLLRRFIPPRSRSFPVKVLTDEDHLEDWKPAWYSEENPSKTPK